MLRTVLISLALAGAARAAEPTDQEILKRIDAMDTFAKDFSVTIDLVIQNDGEKEVFENRVLRDDQGKRLVMLTLKPEINKGSGYLCVGERWWFYDPLTRKFILSSPHEDVAGSEFKTDDFRNKRLTEEYDIAKRTAEKLGDNETYVLELKAKNKLVVMPFRKIWVTKNDFLLLKQEDYSLSKKLVRTLYLTDWKKVGDKFLCMKAFATNEINKGNKSMMTRKDISFDKIGDFVFTKAYLSDVNK
jgi:outer membrane lipoprotein-sorting protein